MTFIRSAAQVSYVGKTARLYNDAGYPLAGSAHVIAWARPGLHSGFSSSKGFSAAQVNYVGKAANLYE